MKCPHCGAQIGLEEKYCPFCEQELTEKAISLIDNYTAFLTDVEAQSIRVFQDYSIRC